MNKVGVAKEIGCTNDVAMIKIGQINKLSIIKLVKNHAPGMEAKAILRIAYRNQKILASFGKYTFYKRCPKHKNALRNKTTNQGFTEKVKS